jgi:hypothetical protein
VKPTSRLVASALGVATLLLVATAAVLSVVGGDFSQSGAGGAIALTLTFLAMGLLVARHQPRNPIGWLFLVTAANTAWTGAGGLYTKTDYLSGHGSWPLGPLVYVGVNAFWPVAILTGLAAILLFPDGRLSRTWRRVLWVYCAFSAAVLITQAVTAVIIARSPRLLHAVAVHAPGTRVPGGAVVQFFGSGLPLLAVVPFWLAFIVRQVIGFRRSAGDARQQYKWFTAGAALSVVGVVMLVTAESGNNPSELAQVANAVGFYVTGIAFPLGMGVAILRYRLYDIDRIISRTLAYAIVTGVLVGLYAGLVILATQVLGFQTQVAVAASTLSAAALFSPLRRRVQHLVDRRFNRARYDADRTIAAFAARLKDGVDPGSVQADLLAAVQQALEPAHATVWVGRSAP